MLRVEPRRWPIILLSTVTFWYIAGLTMVSALPAISSSGALGVAIGATAALGVTGAFFLWLHFARQDSLRRDVERLNPHALVLLVRPDKQTVATLAWPLRARIREHSPLAIAFDSEGMSLWVGGKVPSRRVAFGTASVVSVSPAEMPTRSLVLPPRAGLRVELQVKERHELFFSVDGASFLGITGPAGAIELTALASKASQLLAVATAPPATTTADPIPTLLPGRTAWALDRTVMRVVIIVTAILIAAAIARIVLTGRLGWVFVAFLLVQLILSAARALVQRYTKMEQGAGYTTLNGVELHFPQLHPRTGALLRVAGAPPLTKQQFRDALGPHVDADEENDRVPH